MTTPERPMGGEEQSKREVEVAVRSERERAWQRKLHDIETVRDALGRPLDSGVKEIVAALNIIDIPTSASCEGHIDRGKGAPWLEVGAANRPAERFQGERAIFQEVADRYGVTYEDVSRDTQ